jgi:hypothetical protein
MRTLPGPERRVALRERSAEEEGNVDIKLVVDARFCALSALLRLKLMHQQEDPRF